MIARLDIEGGWMWSAWQPERGMPFNSYFLQTNGGNVVVDPLPLDAADIDRVRELGGVAKIVITNPDHVRASAQLRESFGATVVDAPADGEEIFEGAFALYTEHGKSKEFAVHLREKRAAIVGDALIGVPAGSLSLLPDEKLSDPAAFVMSLRRLWALELRTLLPCDGYPIFSGADEAIGKALHARAGSQIFKIHSGDLPFVHYKREDGKYGAVDGEAGLLIGARKLGYRVAEIPPGKAFCPLHWHVEEEEFFYVISGRPSVRMLDTTLQCRPGDFIAFPVGEWGAHQLLNESAEPAVVMLVGLYSRHETCFYPDSRKVLTDTPDGLSLMVRSEPELEYLDGE